LLYRYGKDLSQYNKTHILKSLSGQAIETVQDLLEWRRKDLLNIHCFGKKTLYLLEITLEKIGVELNS
jgi:DNA-directed RNA polymerase alpha subunit